MLLSLSAPVVADSLGFDQEPKGQTPGRHVSEIPYEDVQLQWKPDLPFVGAPVLFKSPVFSGPATWLDKRIEFRRDGDDFLALAGVNMDRPPGRYPLVFGGNTIEIPVLGHSYPSSKLSVPPKFVQPPKEVRKRIAEEVSIKQKVFMSPPRDRLWKGRFVEPANTRYTSSFGSRRVYNGKTRSVHQGLDYSAAIGTQVTAANSGRIVIGRKFYFEGGFIVIDHGESIFTLYMHLSELLVKEGAEIDKGEPIAKSGSSGRVTGPHLHFGVQWQGIYLEPATLFRLWRV
jgi:murein DD-endopeptidase MepM/ murein hydrolase activator NlpD